MQPSNGQATTGKPNDNQAASVTNAIQAQLDLINLKIGEMEKTNAEWRQKVDDQQIKTDVTFSLMQAANAESLAQIMAALGAKSDHSSLEKETNKDKEKRREDEFSKLQSTVLRNEGAARSSMAAVFARLEASDERAAEDRALAAEDRAKATAQLDRFERWTSGMRESAQTKLRSESTRKRSTTNNLRGESEIMDLADGSEEEPTTTTRRITQSDNARQNRAEELAEATRPSKGNE